MKSKHIILLLLCCAFFTSCENESVIKITNNVHNVKLDKISFADIAVGSNLLPGESAEKTISEYYTEISFPLSSQVEFYLVSADKRIFLKTKETFTLRADDKLTIIIDDNTEVISPMNVGRSFKLNQFPNEIE